MYLAIVCKRSVKFSRIRAQRQNHAINLGEIDPQSHTTIPIASTSNPPRPLSHSDLMEFTKMHNNLNELWERWARSEWKNRVAIVDRSLVMPVNNVLVF